MAIVQPTQLVRGLRRVALGLGVRIFEYTRVRKFSRASPVVIQTDAAIVTVRKFVIATNAWAASIRELSRAITVISSDMIVTARCPDLLRWIGWHEDLSITDS